MTALLAITPPPPRRVENDDDWLTRKEASRYLGTLGVPLSPGTLAVYAANNNARRGPPFIRFGWNVVRYKRGDLRMWVKARVTYVA